MSGRTCSPRAVVRGRGAQVRPPASARQPRGRPAGRLQGAPHLGLRGVAGCVEPPRSRRLTLGLGGDDKEEHGALLLASVWIYAATPGASAGANEGTDFFSRLAECGVRCAPPCGPPCESFLPPCSSTCCKRPVASYCAAAVWNSGQGHAGALQVQARLPLVARNGGGRPRGLVGLQEHGHAGHVQRGQVGQESGRRQRAAGAAAVALDGQLTSESTCACSSASLTVPGLVNCCVPAGQAVRLTLPVLVRSSWVRGFQLGAMLPRSPQPACVWPRRASHSPCAATQSAGVGGVPSGVRLSEAPPALAQRVAEVCPVSAAPVQLRCLTEASAAVDDESAGLLSMTPLNTVGPPVAAPPLRASRRCGVEHGAWAWALRRCGQRSMLSKPARAARRQLPAPAQSVVAALHGLHRLVQRPVVLERVNGPRLPAISAWPLPEVGAPRRGAWHRGPRHPTRIATHQGWGWPRSVLRGAVISPGACRPTRVAHSSCRARSQHVQQFLLRNEEKRGRELPLAGDATGDSCTCARERVMRPHRTTATQAPLSACVLLMIVLPARFAMVNV